MLKELQDAERRLFHAVSFQNAYALLSEHCPFSTTSKIPERNRKDVSPVDYVSIAFSTEIALKAIYKIVKMKNVKNHNLKELFHDLPELIQRGILEQLRRKAPYYDHPEVLNFHLTNVEEGFKRWRYSYEYASLKFSPEFCFEFSKCITDIGFHLVYQEVKKHGLQTNPYPARRLEFPFEINSDIP